MNVMLHGASKIIIGIGRAIKNGPSTSADALIDEGIENVLDAYEALPL